MSERNRVRIRNYHCVSSLSATRLRVQDPVVKSALMESGLWLRRYRCPHVRTSDSRKLWRRAFDRSQRQCRDPRGSVPRSTENARA